MPLQTSHKTIMDLVLDLHGIVADLSAFLYLFTYFCRSLFRFKGEGVWSSMVPVLNKETPSAGKIVTKITQIETKLYMIESAVLFLRNNNNYARYLWRGYCNYDILLGLK